MILRGLYKLTWIEIKVFLREPLGAITNLHHPHSQAVDFPAPVSRFLCRF